MRIFFVRVCACARAFALLLNETKDLLTSQMKVCVCVYVQADHQMEQTNELAGGRSGRCIVRERVLFYACTRMVYVYSSHTVSQPASLYTCMCQLTVKPQQPNMAGRRRKKPPKKNTTNQQIDRYVWTCCGSSQMMIDGTLHTVKWLNSIFFWPVVDNSNLTMFIFIFSSSLNDDDDNIYNG